MPSSHLILSRPLLLLPPIPPSIPIYSYQKFACKSTSSLKSPLTTAAKRKPFLPQTPKELGNTVVLQLQCFTGTFIISPARLN